MSNPKEIALQEMNEILLNKYAKAKQNNNILVAALKLILEDAKTSSTYKGNIIDLCKTALLCEAQNDK